ncbi:MAG TPA: hypothetical protein VF221_19170 [Chloroflexota bacterium]
MSTELARAVGAIVTGDVPALRWEQVANPSIIGYRICPTALRERRA